MKKLFGSLMLGFGAALGVFVALAMPPGGWGVAVGVGLGLLGCLPLLLIMMMLIGRGQTDRRSQMYEEAPPPVIIIQQPGLYDPFPDNAYARYAAASQDRGYLAGAGYNGYPVEAVHPRWRGQAVPPEYNRLPAAHRQTPCQPEMAYPPEDYSVAGYAGEPEEYAAPMPLADPYAAYYHPRYPQTPAYSYADEATEQFYPTSTRRSAPARWDEAVEAEYRTIGESDY